MNRAAAAAAAAAAVALGAAAVAVVSAADPESAAAAGGAPSAADKLRKLALPLVAGAACWLLVVVVRTLLNGFRVEKVMSAVPKVPSRYPLSHLVDLVSGTPWDVMEQWATEHGKKGLVRFHFFGETYVVLADPEAVKRVLQDNWKNYRKDPTTYNVFMCLLGTGLVSSEGPHWARQRKLVSPVLKVGILQETAEVSVAAADRLTAKLEACRGSGEPLRIGEELRHLTLQVIGKSVLSMEPEACDAVFPQLYLPIVDECNLRVWYPYRAYLPTPTNLEFHRTVGKLNSYITRLIEGRRDERRRGASKPEREMDILDRVIEAVSADLERPETIRQLRDEVKTFLLAGHETSSMMLTWSLYQLSRNPECLAKVRAEALAVFGEEGVKKGGVIPPLEQLDGLQYTQQVLFEALRLYSVVPVVTREAVADDKVCGDFGIAAGSKVVIHMQALHNRPDLWEDPQAFRPERFGEKFDPWTWIPFINGPRQCIGRHFALLESKIVLALLVTRFDFEAAPGEVGDPHPFNVPRAPLDGMRVLLR